MKDDLCDYYITASGSHGVTGGIISDRQHGGCCDLSVHYTTRLRHCPPPRTTPDNHADSKPRRGQMQSADHLDDEIQWLCGASIHLVVKTAE
jgi:hypothetical protein